MCIGRNSSVSPKDRKPTTFGHLGRVTRSTSSPTHRPMRSISLPMEDTSALTTQSIMAMSQTELLECIFSRLEELEHSQNRTSVQVKVLSTRLAPNRSNLKPEDVSVDEEKTFTDRYEEDFEEDLDIMMKGDGEDEAWLLHTMRKGTPVTLLPYEEC